MGCLRGHGIIHCQQMALVQTSREYGLYFRDKLHCHFPPLRSALNQPLPQGFLRVYGPFQKQTLLFVSFFLFSSFYFFGESASVVIFISFSLFFFSPLLLFLLFIFSSLFPVLRTFFLFSPLFLMNHLFFFSHSLVKRREQKTQLLFSEFFEFRKEFLTV